MIKGLEESFPASCVSCTHSSWLWTKACWKSCIRCCGHRTENSQWFPKFPNGLLDASRHPNGHVQVSKKTGTEHIIPLEQHAVYDALSHQTKISHWSLWDNLPTALVWTSGVYSKRIKLLELFEELTRQVSSMDSSVADVIPAITALLRILKEDYEGAHGVGSIENPLLQVVRRHFADIERNSLYSSIQGNWVATNSNVKKCFN